MNTVNITQSELLDALTVAQAPDAPVGAMTAAELRVALGIKETALKMRLRKLQDEGRLDVWRTTRRDVSGREQPVPAYTIRPAPKPTRKRGS